MSKRKECSIPTISGLGDAPPGKIAASLPSSSGPQLVEGQKIVLGSELSIKALVALKDRTNDQSYYTEWTCTIEGCLYPGWPDVNVGRLIAGYERSYGWKIEREKNRTGIVPSMDLVTFCNMRILSGCKDMEGFDNNYGMERIKCYTHKKEM